MGLATFYDHVKDISRQEGISILEAMERTKSLGVDLLEISANNILGREEELKKELETAGMGISSIPAYFDFGRNPDVKAQSTSILEAARFLGAKRMLVIPGFWGEEDTAEEKEKQTKAMVEGMNTLCDLAETYGVAMVMEDYDSELAPFSNIRGLQQFLEGCPKLSIAFDTGNFRFMGESEVEAFEALKNRITHVHLKDRALSPTWGEHAKTAVTGENLYAAPVGQGVIRIAEILQLLREMRYEGIYTVEHYDSSCMWRNLQQSVEWLKEKI